MPLNSTVLPRFLVDPTTGNRAVVNENNELLVSSSSSAVPTTYSKMTQSSQQFPPTVNG